jgi:hypothetical protein
VRIPAVSSRSLTAIGSPCSAPGTAPAASLRSASAAARRAPSASSVTIAFSSGLTCSMRARCASMTSTAEISRRRMRAVRSVAVSRQIAGSLISARDAARRSREARPRRADCSRNRARRSSTRPAPVTAWPILSRRTRPLRRRRAGLRVPRRPRRRQVPAPNGMSSSRVGGRGHRPRGGRASRRLPSRRGTARCRPRSRARLATPSVSPLEARALLAAGRRGPVAHGTSSRERPSGWRFSGRSRRSHALAV